MRADDAALLEWGSSAIIHNADGVVVRARSSMQSCSRAHPQARFGPSAAHPEFQLGVEAELVTANPRQGCKPLINARLAATQIVVMVQGKCTFGEKARNAADAGAVALLVVNSERRSPDRAFAMSAGAKGETAPSSDDERAREAELASLPSVMISYAAGQQLREHAPPRMRLFAGGGRPFIESVTDAAPVVYLVHNAILESEAQSALAKLEPYLAPTAADANVHRAHRVLGALRGSELSAFYDRLASIVGYPVEHLSDPALELRTSSSSPFAAKDERRLSRFNVDLGDDARLQTVMSVHVFLDDLDDDESGLYFPRARPAPIRLKTTKNVAAVWYSALEDGSLDATAAHGEGPIPKHQRSRVLHLRVYNAPRTLARRVVLPLLLLPVAGAPSKTIVFAAKRFFGRAFGHDAALENGIDLALYAFALLVLAPFALAALAAFKAYERSKAPPKRRTTNDKKKANLGKKA